MTLGRLHCIWLVCKFIHRLYIIDQFLNSEVPSDAGNCCTEKVHVHMYVSYLINDGALYFYSTHVRAIKVENKALYHIQSTLRPSV